SGRRSPEIPTPEGVGFTATLGKVASGKLLSVIGGDLPLLARRPRRSRQFETSRRRPPDSGSGAVESCPEVPDICRAAGQRMVWISSPKHMYDRVFSSARMRSDICLEGRGDRT